MTFKASGIVWRTVPVLGEADTDGWYCGAAEAFGVEGALSREASREKLLVKLPAHCPATDPPM
jgi:hypothetical protein